MRQIQRNASQFSPSTSATVILFSFAWQYLYFCTKIFHQFNPNYIFQENVSDDDTSDDDVMDVHIGKTVYIDTVGPKGKRYGWLKAIVESRNEDGTYLARYDQGHPTRKHTTVIKDILDENFVRFYPSIAFNGA